MVPPPLRATPTPGTRIPNATATTPPTITPTPAPSPTPLSYHVSVLNRDFTPSELDAEIQKEGSLTVANWTYGADDAIVQQFQMWVKNNFGADVQLHYQGKATPQDYLTNLYAAQKANQPAPYDVIAVEENYYTDAVKNNAVAQIYPSDLLNNWTLVDPSLRHDPNAVAFQSSATIAPIFHKDNVGSWFTDWKDLADPRLKMRLTLPLPGDTLAGGFLLGVAQSLGKDYKSPDQMSAAIDFVCTQIQPNVLKFTSDLNEQRQLLREDRVDVAVGWNLLARLEGLSGVKGTEDVTFQPMSSGQPAINGYLWIPQGAPHPILAQLFMNWRLSNDGQLPGDAWDIPHNAWTEYHEGLLGPSYQSAIPNWIQPDYNQFYPSLDDLHTKYHPIDWDYYAQHQADWMTQYSQCAK